jgi:maltose-binding protein MalE
MNLLCRFIIPSILASLCLLAVPTTAPAQVPSRDGAASLQKKANEAQARIRGNEGDSDQLKKAVKTNEVALAKEILLRNGFTAKDLENAKISLRTGGGKGGEDTIEISVTCCDPKEITIQRTLENFTK